MQSTILINGLLPYDSGKTYFALALAKALMNRGVKVLIYKPVAGHSAWYQFKTVINSLKYGILVGEDVVKYKEILGLQVNLELLNPIDFLLAPLNPKLLKEVKEYLSLIGDQLSQMILIRISNCQNGLTQHFIIEHSERRIVPGLKPWIEKLIKKLKPEPISLKEVLSIMYSPDTSKLLDQALQLIRDKSEVVIVESFNDAAIPYYNLLNKVDLVFTVAPGYVFKLRTDDFKTIVESYYLRYSDIGLTMSKLIDEVRIVSELPLPPVSSVHELSIYIKGKIRYLMKSLLSR